MFEIRMKYLIVCAKNPIFWVGAIMDATNLKNQIRLSNVWPNQNWIFRIFRRKLNFFCSVYHCVYHKMPRIRKIMHLFLRLGLSHFFCALVQFDMWDLPKGFFYETQVTYITFLLGCLYMPRSLPLLGSIWRCGKPQNHWNLPLEKLRHFTHDLA